MSGGQQMLLGSGLAPFSVEASPLLADGLGVVVGTGSVSVPVTTVSTTTTPTNGVAPITYLWEYISGDVATVNSATAATTTFSRTEVGTSPFSVIRTGLYRCKGTDGVGRIVYTSSVTVETEHEADL